MFYQPLLVRDSADAGLFNHRVRPHHNDLVVIQPMTLGPDGTMALRLRGKQ
jgi:hypothetical protein